MSQLEQFILKQKEESNKTLAMTHVIYGYPSVQESLAWMEDLLTIGVELLEVQFPFSDPVADGETIVNACHHALANEFTMQDCLAHLAALSNAFPNSKILLMSYLNPIFKFGIRNFVEQAAQSSISGIIIPDLSVENAQEYQQACLVNKIEPIWLVTPNTPSDRLKMIAQKATGLLYCVSRSGVTGGVQQNSNRDLNDYLREIKRYTTIPLAVGFGIRKKEQVDAVSEYADVAIIGSALLEKYDEDGTQKALNYVRELFPHLNSSHLK